MEAINIDEILKKNPQVQSDKVRRILSRVSSIKSSGLVKRAGYDLELPHETGQSGNIAASKECSSIIRRT